MNSMLNVSIVVPAYNEKESLPELCKWIDEVLTREKISYEVLIVDDGSKDGSWEEIERIASTNASVKGIRFRRNYGKSAALNEGFKAACGEVVVTMDADLQDSPEEVPELRKMIIEDGFDLVSGWKKVRHDPITKTIPTKLYNGVTRMMSGIQLNDFNCGLKAYDYSVVKSIEVYGEMHRYIPVIAKFSGFENIGEKVVQHQARKHGKSKFGSAKRFINGPLDLLSIIFISRFGKKPMHFFGSIGSLLFIIGFGIATYLSYEKIFNDVTRMTDRPIFYLGLLCMILGSQSFLTGFITEMLSRNNPERNNYTIDRTLNLD